MSKKLLNMSVSFSLSKLILKSPTIMISLLQLSKLDIIAVNSSINTFKSSFRLPGNQYIFPIVNVLDRELSCTLTINLSNVRRY